MELLYKQSEWLILAGLIIGLFAAAQIGSALGSRQRRKGAETPNQSVLGALLGLLGLLLGFTFSMSLSRYETRRTLVVEEANAIGTTYLRAELLPDPIKGAAISALRSYVDTRLEPFNGGINDARLSQAIASSEQAHRALWDLAIAAARDPSASPPIVSLFINALNQTIDVHSLRMTAMRSHVPEAILFLIMATAIVSSMVLGYGFGLAGNRYQALTLGFCLVTSMVVMVIIDLDRPHRGLIRVSQQPMLDLQASMHAEMGR